MEPTLLIIIIATVVVIIVVTTTVALVITVTIVIVTILTGVHAEDDSSHFQRNSREPKVRCQLVSAEPPCSCHNLLLDLRTARCWFREILGSCLKTHWGLGGNSGIYYLGTIQRFYPLIPYKSK